MELLDGRGPEWLLTRGVTSGVIMFDREPKFDSYFRLFVSQARFLAFCVGWVVVGLGLEFPILIPPSVDETEGSCIPICSISLFDLQHFRRLVCVECQDTAIAFIGGREQKGRAHKEPKSSFVCHNFSTNSPFLAGFFYGDYGMGGGWRYQYYIQLSFDL